eukprot:EG_transcript_11329
MPTPDSTFLEGTENSQLESDVTQQDPFLALATEHANGESMPSGELHLQSILNSDITPSYSLKEVPGLDNWAAQAIIFFEIKTNFPNALAHVREAREMFPEDQVLQQGDFQVLKSLRQNPPSRPVEPEKDSKGFFERFFSSIKKDNPEKKEDKEKDKGLKKSKDSLLGEEGAEEEPTTDPAKSGAPKGKKEKFSILNVFSLPKKKDDLEDSKKKKSKDKLKASSKEERDDDAHDEGAGGLVDHEEQGSGSHDGTAPPDQEAHADGPYELPPYDLPHQESS